ncbi:glycosyltransferase family A protein [Pokkaliibacter sp. MBI-7]|uniref:glycosyltransferase family 2 protein n=1 Tax=Pokkaliibacter sp. MBI-7 TaxID=3040600 RepID=UPI002446A065|nr:glycosyltransferase family A protein [Pokkaliibacter sp. MBI-7]MDH2431293.1 glycosyltransferase family A protein [Pokkaliibacter sp. MBI-7]
MSELPLVQVLLPVFNSEDYIEACLDSLLQQTYKNFSVLILDDCSNDATAAKILPYLKDERFHISQNDKNIGIIPSRNILLAAATAEFIAFMDADDICMPDRLAEQVSYMVSHSDIAVVGSWYKRFGANDGEVRPPTDPVKIKAALKLDNVVCNPSVLIRREIIVKGGFLFDIAYQGAADYKFFYDIAQHHMISNLPMFLLAYRTHAKQESSLNNDRQKKAHAKVVENAWADMGVDIMFSTLQPLVWPHQASSESLLSAGRCVANTCEKSLLTDRMLEGEIKAFIELRLKSFCRQHGIKGLIAYLRTLGFRQLVKGRNMGLSFTCDCIKKQFLH